MTPSSRFYLNERNGALSLHHQIDVPVAAPEPALNHPPALSFEPPLRDPFSQFAKRLPGRCHTEKILA